MILRKQSPSAIYAEWQNEIETKLEAGQTPLLDFGASQLVLGDLPLFMALRTFVARRTDVTAPLMLAGGSSALWLTLLMQAHSTGVPRRSPDPMVVFAGADQVTYLATLTTLTPERLVAPGWSPRAVPANMAPVFAPAAQARATLPWDALPLALLEEEKSANLAEDTQPMAGVDAWLGWSAIGLTIFIVLLAFFI